MGDLQKAFPLTLELIADDDMQLRHNAIESARKSANKLLEDKCGKNFFLQLRLYPHHILRENPLASGAGADRMSTGMTMSFGKPIGIAAQCPKGKVLAVVKVDQKDMQTGIAALKRMQHKVPVHCLIRQAA
jgi:large subunit ribosomal protein L10e